MSTLIDPKKQNQPEKTDALSEQDVKKLKEEILALKKEKNAVILAHYYQTYDLKEVADFVGDSLALSKSAANTSADTIVFAGVHFMAEVAKIINPSKRVLIPDMNAGCSLAESCPAPNFKAFVEAHPEHTVISYINCSADIKALSDVICTSSNAEKIIASFPQDQPIIFAPDKNLGHFLNTKTGRDMLLWDGVCTVHESFSLQKLEWLKSQHPTAELVVHPESAPAVLERATFVGSTSAMLKYMSQSDAPIFIVGTEVGLLDELRNANPTKQFIPLPIAENNSCACSECEFMKLNTLQKLHAALKTGKPEITLSETLRIRAEKPLLKMFELSAN